jgi:hypothetical protein
MDKRKYRIILLNLSIICFLSLTGNVFADDFEKPFLKLPQVNITGQDGQDFEFSEGGIIPAEMVSAALIEEPAESQTQGFVTSSYGNFNSKMFEVKHAMQAESFYYNAYLKAEDSNGDRDNTQFSLFEPRLKVGMPFYGENEIVYDLQYFDKKMGLPGKTDMVTLDSERRNSDVYTSFRLNHQQEDTGFGIEPYYGLSIFNDAAGREDFKNKVVGVKFKNENEFFTIDANAYQNRLINEYERAITSAEIRSNVFELSDELEMVLGINAFAQEEFGQRPAPFIEFVFFQNDESLHKLTVTREFSPVLFNQTYLKEHYVEVNDKAMRPVRSSKISYALDQKISSQWRANLLLYFSQDKDYWFFADQDNNGFYKPVSMEQVNFTGMKVSTEYHWSEEFNYFLSLELRRIRSKDSNYEFVPYEPKQKFSLGVTYQMHPKAKLDIVGDYLGRRYFEGNAKASSSGYFAVGSKFTYTPKDYLTFFALVDNLLNDHYEIVKGYPNQSRSLLSGVTVRF